MPRLSLVALLCTAAAGAAAAAAASGHSQEKPWVPNLPGGGVEWTSFANATRQDGAAPSDRPILALLHDLMAVPGLAEGTWPPDASLKEYLDLSTEEDLDDEAWYVEAFPDELELRHTLAVFQLMRTRTD